MKTETLIELQRGITQGWWVKSGFNVYDYKTDHFLLTTGDAVSVPREEKSANARAIALVPELIAEVIRLRVTLNESVSLNENFVSVVEPEALLHLSEYRAVIKQARAALANDK